MCRRRVLLDTTIGTTKGTLKKAQSLCNPDGALKPLKMAHFGGLNFSKSKMAPKAQNYPLRGAPGRTIANYTCLFENRREVLMGTTPGNTNNTVGKAQYLSVGLIGP